MPGKTVKISLSTQKKYSILKKHLETHLFSLSYTVGYALISLCFIYYLLSLLSPSLPFLLLVMHLPKNAIKSLLACRKKKKRCRGGIGMRIVVAGNKREHHFEGRWEYSKEVQLEETEDIGEGERRRDTRWVR